MPIAAVGISTLDKVLIFVALGSSLAGLAGVIFLKFFFPDNPAS
jgi:branched-subunit amino acid ABC-type transport system permease component